jgi:hypothetical protein
MRQPASAGKQCGLAAFVAWDEPEQRRRIHSSGVTPRNQNHLAVPFVPSALPFAVVLFMRRPDAVLARITGVMIEVPLYLTHPRSKHISIAQEVGIMPLTPELVGEVLIKQFSGLEQRVTQHR